MKATTFLRFANSQKIDHPGYLVAIILSDLMFATHFNLTPHYRVGYIIYILQNRKVLQSA